MAKVIETKNGSSFTRSADGKETYQRRFLVTGCFGPDEALSRVRSVVKDDSHAPRTTFGKPVDLGNFLWQVDVFHSTDSSDPEPDLIMESE